MSSILKALKKLEEEKSHLQEEREINVSREILRQQPDNGSLRKWLLLGGGVAAAVIIFLTLALIRATATREEPKAGSMATSAPAPPPLSTTMRQEIAPQEPGRSKRDPGSAPAPSPGEEKPGKGHQTPVSTIENAAKMEKVELPATHTPPQEPVKTEPAAKPSAARENRSGDPGLTLSGIAWNKDSADRLAIINGQPTATGGTVNGAVVEEILPDRVKLSHNGRIVELFIGRNARTD